jgi:membrane-bound serine protease (ClpP class)
MRHGVSTIVPIVALSILMLASPLVRAASVPAAAGETAAVVRLEGKIDDYSRKAFVKRFDQAKAAGAKVVIVDIDTYGGLVTSALDLSRYLKSQTGVRTIAYVGEKAISAGAMIALACDEIVMAPGAQLGDCAPIATDRWGGVQSLGDAERAKTESPILADFADSARGNGYDPLLAQAMVSVKTAVYWLQGPGGERRFVDPSTRDALAAQGWTPVVDADVSNPVDTEATLLTVTGRTAAKLGLARSTAASYDALAAERKLTIANVYAPGAGDAVVGWLNNPVVRMLLIIVLAQALYAALHVPGHGFAEALAVIALALLAGVPLLTGYAQWWEILVIVGGIVLLALEVFVLPGFGVPGILGLLMILFGLVMTFVGTEPTPGFWPRLDDTWAAAQRGLMYVTSALAVSIVLAVYLGKFLPKVPYFNRLILSTTAGDVPPPTESTLPGYRPVVGAIGEALHDLKPGGSASFFDPMTGQTRAFSVVSDVGYVKRGTKLAVQSNADNRVVVRPVVLS